MIPVTELRKGVTFEFGGSPYKVLEYHHIKVGRGGATIRVSVRNLVNGGTEEKTFNNGASVKSINTVKRRLQYLYEAENAVFMDPKTFEQVEIGKTAINQELVYLKEGQQTDVLFWEERALGIELPPNVTLTVTEADPGVKGNSASNFYKPAKLENGLQVKVPLFIKVGEKVRVDTRTGQYVERA
ncbi:MAG: elongation factor P [Microgenomates group bacterium Gr01-1014_5]|nr:MAG: elongation factor P [Microgenomates group bacterium Gr01-1014_5]